MLTLKDLRGPIRSPLPLHITPWWLNLVGFPYWRFISTEPETYGRWVYLTGAQYEELFYKARN